MVAYSREMKLAAGPQFSPGQLVAAAVGFTLLGLMLALLLAGALHAALHAAGAFRTKPGAALKFSWWLAVLGVGLCAVVGGWTGLKIGVARAVVPVARDLGPKMLEEGLQQALRRAGVTNFAQLDVKQLRELVAKAESAQLPPLDFPGAEQLRPQIEAARAKLLPAAKALIEAHAKAGKLALNEVVTSLWPQLFAELAAWERHFRRWEIISGILWVVAIEAALAAGCLVVRLTRKSPPTRSATPPNL